MTSSTRTRAGWLRPPRLRAEDSIAVVAPSGPVPRKSFEKGVRELERLALRPRWRDDIFDRSSFVAGSVKRRRREWLEAWRDDSVRGVIAARGGAGAAQILPLPDAALYTDHARIFCGFSDLTFLHADLQSQRLVSFYGPMVAWDLAHGDSDGYDRDLFRRLLFDGEPGGVISPAGIEGLRPGRGEGRLAGGCLSLLSALMGTPQNLDLRDTILLIEDEKEYPHRVDRYLHHLRRAGAFEGVRGVVLGEFPECDSGRPGEADITRVMQDFFGDFPGPVLMRVPFGHTSSANLTLPLGTWARLDGDRGTLELLESAVV